MAELVTTSLAEYHDLALRLARDPAALAQAKRRATASRHTPLFDTAGFTRNLERAYRTIVERQRSGLAPDHVTISEPPAAGVAVAASATD
jgi:predicted O-linked N-acetylglucosamine transferase (SPINDLY family)